jgi:hypothetical protein
MGPRESETAGPENYFHNVLAELMPLPKGNMSDEEMLRLFQRRVDDEIASRE